MLKGSQGRCAGYTRRRLIGLFAPSTFEPELLMVRLEIGKHLAADTRVCAGRLIFRDTRILASDALELCDAGYTPEAISIQYRGLVKPEAVREAVSLTRRGVIREVEAPRGVIVFDHNVPRNQAEQPRRWHIRGG